jgi:hypothetical protein
MKIMVLRRNSRKELLATSRYCAAFRVWNLPQAHEESKNEESNIYIYTYIYT